MSSGYVAPLHSALASSGHVSTQASEHALPGKAEGLNAMVSRCLGSVHRIARRSRGVVAVLGSILGVSTAVNSATVTGLRPFVLCRHCKFEDEGVRRYDANLPVHSSR